MVYFNKKAQTLTELATFGSILLLVLSFLISYGVRYNYQQDMQMAAFRRALSEAHASGRPDASASVVMVEDKHIPDPRDMFGAGSVVSMQAGAEVAWGNTMQDQYDISNESLLPRVKYVFNDKDVAKRVEREYTTAGYGFIANGTEFYAILPGNNEPELISWSNVKCYQPTPDSPKQAMVLLPDNEKEVITEVYLKPAGAGSAKKFIKYQIIGVETIPPVPPDGSDGKPIDWISLLRPDFGGINPNYMQLNSDVDRDGIPDVTQDNVQGVLLDSEQKIKRRGTLTIEETPGTSASTAAYSFKDKAGNPTTIIHKIRSSSGVENISSPFERNRVSEWKITK
ncbi:MAG: hypothetical protein Q8N62_08095 [Candidatus Omnitrophota bacterium]|nr:hypothetical protein [Candidatus Omnitrophota bacterium]